jgi:archaeosine-15-forming tRNA-guanine transglycosylase
MFWQEVLREQLEMRPKEDIALFDGQWVLLHGGRVIAHALELSDLSPGDGDALLRVRTTPAICL